MTGSACFGLAQTLRPRSMASTALKTGGIEIAEMDCTEKQGENKERTQ